MSEPIAAMQLSPYGRASVTPAPVNRMMSAFAADFRPAIDMNLGVGYVNEATLPRGPLQEALAAVLADPDTYRHPLNYGGPEGSANLIAAIRRFLSRPCGGAVPAEVLDRREIIIAPCGATSLLDALGQVLPRGLVVTSDPVYYIYAHYLERCGFEILAVPEDADGLDPDRLEQALAQLGADVERVSFFYIVTVNNPTSTILTADRQRRLVEMVTALGRRLGRRVPLFLDKAYEHLVHDPAATAPGSALADDSLGVVHEIHTLSKILAPALRVGYLVGPDSDLLRALIQKTSDAGFSAPLVMQEMAAYLLDHQVEPQLAAVNAGYRDKARRTRQWIDRHLGAEVIDCRGGSAGFYYYLTFRRVETHEPSRFFRFLTRTTGDAAIDGGLGGLEPRVLYIPGEHCVHRGGRLTDIARRQLRISYGYEEPDRLERALQLMGEALAYARRG